MLNELAEMLAHTASPIARFPEFERKINLRRWLFGNDVVTLAPLLSDSSFHIVVLPIAPLPQIGTSIGAPLFDGGALLRQDVSLHVSKVAGVHPCLARRIILSPFWDETLA